MSDSNEQTTADATERALRTGLRANTLTPEALQRIRAATEQEWREQTRAPARRRVKFLAIAASVAGLAAALGVTYFSMSPGTAEGAAFGQVAAADAPGIVELRRFGADSVLAAGTTLRAGQRLETRGDTLIDVERGGNLRVARASALEIRDADTVRITRGELYVDIPPGSHAASSLRVQTSAGEFRHVGTQFAVMVAEGQTRLRVREGTVLWHANGGDSTLAAGSEVTIDRNGKATRRQVSTTGRDWAWTEVMAPDVVIENRPLLEFLQWFARETGRKLDIDEPSRQQASSILMHGSVKGLTLTEALSAVMATTTTLKYELPEGAIRVSSTRDPKAPRT